MEQRNQVTDEQFEKAFNEYESLFWYTLHRLKCPLTEDYVQEAKMAFFKALATFDPTKDIKFSTYLVDIIRKRIIVLYRYNAVHRIENTTVGITDALAEYIPDEDIELSFERLYTKLHIELFMKTLNARQRKYVEAVMSGYNKGDATRTLHISREWSRKLALQVKYKYMQFMKSIND